MSSALTGRSGPSEQAATTPQQHVLHCLAIAWGKVGHMVILESADRKVRGLGAGCHSPASIYNSCDSSAECPGVPCRCMGQGWAHLHPRQAAQGPLGRLP